MIPVNTPVLGGDEASNLRACLETGWISSEGPFVRQFEKDMAAYLGREHAIAVSSGTAALDIAIEAAGIGPGDEVIVPTFTIISCVGQIVRAGAKPVLVDSDRETWNMDVSQMRDRITLRTKAILVVHIYGLPVDMQPVIDLADEFGLQIIEDAAEVLGQTCRGQRCGSFGAMSTFSFYPNKHVTTGEGGLVATDDGELAETCRGLRNLCFKPGQRFVHDRLGWNYRMTNLQAALGVAQLKRIDDTVARKRRIGRRYQAALEDLTTVQRPLARTDYAENIYWVFGLVLADGAGPDALAVMAQLAERGIGTRPFFCPMHRQPVLRSMDLFAGETYPVADHLYRNGFYIPSGLGLIDEQQETVIGALHELLQ